MSDAIYLGDPPIKVHLSRSARARRLSLRVSRLDGAVRLSLPNRAPMAEATAFLRDREGWIRDQLAAVARPITPSLGDTIPIGGRPHLLSLAQGRRPAIKDDTIDLPEGRVLPALKALLRSEARARLVGASDHYAAQLGRGYGRITLRDTRSRWGSCTSRGDLMYSWRLIMAPPQVLNYVAAHEVAHLQEMNHAPAFWDIVTRLDPDWRASRDWLRQNGAELHRYRFED